MIVRNFSELKRLTSVSVGYGHLPDADVAEDVAQELSQGERYDELEVVAPRYQGAAGLPDAPQVEHRAREQGDGCQLDHRHRYWVGKLGEQRLDDDVRGR